MIFHNRGSLVSDHFSGNKFPEFWRHETHKKEIIICLFSFQYKNVFLCVVHCDQRAGYSWSLNMTQCLSIMSIKSVNCRCIVQKPGSRSIHKHSRNIIARWDYHWFLAVRKFLIHNGCKLIRIQDEKLWTMKSGLMIFIFKADKKFKWWVRILL